MRAILSTILAICLTVALTGCGNNSMQRVQNGTLKFDKSVTVKDALEGYQYFKNKEWQTFKTSQGREIVQFTGEMNLDGYANSTVTGISLSSDLIAKAKSTLLGVSYVIQFAVSKTDNTFQIAGASIKIKVKNQETGKEEDKEIADSNLSTLQAIYRNALDPRTWAVLFACS